MTLSKKSADVLWSDLRSGLINVESKLREIIDTKAWEPLGYASFSDAWAARMKGVRLGSDLMRAQVVYALVDSGAESTEDVADHLGLGVGITPEMIEKLRQQKEAGVPVELASTRVWGRTKTDTPKTRPIMIGDIPADVYSLYEELSKAAGSTLEREAAKAVHGHFMQIKSRVEKKRESAA